MLLNSQRRCQGREKCHQLVNYRGSDQPSVPAELMTFRASGSTASAITACPSAVGENAPPKVLAFKRSAVRSFYVCIGGAGGHRSIDQHEQSEMHSSMFSSNAVVLHMASMVAICARSNVLAKLASQAKYGFPQWRRKYHKLQVAHDEPSQFANRDYLRSCALGYQTSTYTLGACRALWVASIARKAIQTSLVFCSTNDSAVTSHSSLCASCQDLCDVSTSGISWEYLLTECL